jgi:tRNA G37 N-methylase TrmD
MNAELLYTILHFLPKKNRNEASEQINYYLKELKYKSDQGQSFIFSDDKLEIIIYALVVYQRIILPIGHSNDFYERMVNEFNVSSISVGSYSLNEKSTEATLNIVEEFIQLVKYFFISNGIKEWEKILSAESLNDLIRVLRIPEYE